MADDLCFSTSSSSSSYSLKKNNNFQLIICIILHDLSLICSFIISYPLYFSYVIFFSPYVIKLISFISPLFIATVCLSVLLTTTTTAFCPNLTQLKLGILQSVIQELKSNLNAVSGDEEECNFEDFEIYKIVFDGTLSITICNEGDEVVSLTKKILENSITGGRRNDVMTSDSDKYHFGVEKILENSVHGSRRNDVTISDSEVDKLKEQKGLEKLLEELDIFEDFTPAIETSADSDKVNEELQKAAPTPVEKVGSGSETESVAISSSDIDRISQNSGRSSSWRSNSSSILSSHGSMRDEKEWRKTLACKLFEERHNSRGGEEGMDSLWESYEKNINNGGNQSFNDEYDEYDDDDEEMSNGHLCCLQALKLSTGKMNFGMRKPNFVKISKALKGLGWLHHVKNKHDQNKSFRVDM